MKLSVKLIERITYREEEKNTKRSNIIYETMWLGKMKVIYINLFLALSFLVNYIRQFIHFDQCFYFCWVIFTLDSSRWVDEPLDQFSWILVHCNCFSLCIHFDRILSRYNEPSNKPKFNGSVKRNTRQHSVWVLNEMFFFFLLSLEYFYHIVYAMRTNSSYYR